MTTTHIGNRINQLVTPNDAVLEADAAGTQKTPSGPWAIVSPRPQGIRVMQLVLSRSEPGVLIDTSGMVPYYGVLRDLWGTETNIPEASKQPSVRIIFHKDTEATPLGQHFPRSANTGDAIWLHLLGEDSSVISPSVVLPTEVEKFKNGIDGEEPTKDVIDTALQIAQAAVELTADPEFFFDSDGSLSFDLRLSNGQRLMAELTIYGELDAGFYDDAHDELYAKEVRYFSQTTAQELIRFLQ